MEFSDIITNFSLEDIDVKTFLTNALLGAFLSWCVSVYYKRFGKSVTNRRLFANNFVLLTLTTMLIITIVKSSIALSLGLVGALSIVRFRAAIKEPEELIYLFLVIAIGLGMGADQPEITLVAFLLIMAVLIIVNVANKNTLISNSSQMQLSITSDIIDVRLINEALSAHAKNVDLKRMSQSNDKMYLSYVLETKSFETLSTLKDQLIEISPSMEVSFIDNSRVNG